MTNNKQWEIEWEKKFDGTHTIKNWALEECNCEPFDIKERKTCECKIKSFIQQTLNTQRYELLSQIKGIGCEEGVDLVTVAKIINKLNETIR
jgi:cobalamin biosynthesis protein CbiG